MHGTAASNLLIRFDGGEIAVGGDTLTTIGRDPTSTVYVDHPLVSRRHAVIRREVAGWVLEDAGSSNGTYRDGAAVERTALEGEVIVYLGHPTDGPAMTFLTVAPARDEELPPGSPSAIHAATDRVRVGRDPASDIVLEDLLVSRHHAEMIRQADRTYEIVDLDSHNGTFLNGRRVRRASLRQGDTVAIGRHRLALVGERLEEYVDSGDVAYEARGLAVRTPAGQILLDDVSLALGGRSFLGVVGPSGAGKSTLLGALTGFNPATEGRVIFGGHDLYAEYEDLGQRIGFVPQDDILHPELTVRQALEYAAELRFPPDVGPGDRRARVTEVLAELGLAHRAEVRISRLSGGQRKRVSVALELLTRPSLLFLDEPTSGLDPGIERSVMQLLRRLADDGRTVIVVTHTVQSLRLCDRVLVLAPGGAVAYFGPPELAPAYFECDDYDQVFQALEQDEGAAWKTRFRRHPIHEEYVATPLARPAPPPAQAPAPAPPAARRGSWARQLSTLVRRYAVVIAADRRTAAVLLLQAPLLGALMLITLPVAQLSLPDPGEIPLVSRSSLVLFNLIVGATYLGAANATREIVKELPVLQRERAVGISLSAYVTSKAAVLGVLTVAQAAVFTVVATARQDGPADALVLGSPLLELAVVVALTGLAAMSLGLVLSAFAPTVDRAMTLLPVVLILQLTLASGGLFPELVDKPGLKQMTYAAGPQWGFTAAATTVDLNRLQPLNAVAQELPPLDLRDPTDTLTAIRDAPVGDDRLRHDARRWWTAVMALVGLAVGGLIVTYLLLRRRDPGGT